MSIKHEATHWHKKKLGTWPNIDNPKTFNEKIDAVDPAKSWKHNCGPEPTLIGTRKPQK